MLKVSRMPSGEPEIFRSIQGEGVSAGTPTIFLRLATCNLACTWCDTKYTWDWKNHDYNSEVISMSEEEVEERVLALDYPHLVITGGEPLLQQSFLVQLVTSLNSGGFYCEVETNGTLIPLPKMVDAVSQWNVSPKTRSSGNRHQRREVPHALSAFQELDNTYFKFVIVEPPDVKEVCRLAERFQISPQRVILMPEGVTAQTLRERGEWIAEACAQHGFRFRTRLHILLWGNQRGR